MRNLEKDLKDTFNEVAKNKSTSISFKDVWSKYNNESKTLRKSKSSRRLFTATVVSIAGICAALALIVPVVTSHVDTSTKTFASSVNPNSFDLSFVTEPTQSIPSWINHGNGIVASITIQAWNPQYYKKYPNDGVYIVPTSTQPTQQLSFYELPPTPNGLQSANGSGPSSLTSAVNKYFREHNLAQLQQGSMTEVTSIRGTFKNVSFPAAIGNSGFPKLQANDVRLVILDVREQGDSFKVMWSKMYSPTNLSE